MAMRVQHKVDITVVDGLVFINRDGLVRVLLAEAEATMDLPIVRETLLMLATEFAQLKVAV